MKKECYVSGKNLNSRDKDLYGEQLKEEIRTYLKQNVMDGSLSPYLLSPYEIKGVIKKLTKNCIACGHEFFTVNPGHKYFCSRDCAKNNIGLIKQLGLRTKKKRKVHRWDIFNRDNFQCQYCGKTPTKDKVRLHIDHIKPRIDGGQDVPDNFVTACEECNLSKKDKPLRHESQFRARLKDLKITQ